jgi:hypothetical protein
MRSSNAIRSYSKLETQSRVEQQQPEQLIALLYDKACTLVRQAGNALDNENTQLFHDSTTHATQIRSCAEGHPRHRKRWRNCFAVVRNLRCHRRCLIQDKENQKQN